MSNEHFLHSAKARLRACTRGNLPGDRAACASQATRARAKAPVLASAALAAAIAACCLFPGLARSATNDAPAPELAQGGALVINSADVQAGRVSFYPCVVDGTRMDVMAVKDGTGYVRTALNTCQVCFGSKKAYFVQQEGYVVCQNCGNKFSLDQLETSAGGCNPVPVMAQDKTSTPERTSIPYETLAKSRHLFAKWKPQR